MSFKTQAEIYQALLDGKTVSHDTGKQVKLFDGEVWSSTGNSYWSPDTIYFDTPKDWSLYEEPKKVTLYRYTIESDKIFQSGWTSEIMESNSYGKILKTETKEVEI